MSSYFWCLCEVLSTREKCNGAVQDHQARVHAERTAAFEERTKKGKQWSAPCEFCYTECLYCALDVCVLYLQRVSEIMSWSFWMKAAFHRYIK